MAAMLHARNWGGGVYPPLETTCGFLSQQVFCKRKATTKPKKSVTPFLTGAPPPKKNPGSAPGSQSIKNIKV